MVVLHGGVAWWCCMVVLHGGVAWWCCIVLGTDVMKMPRETKPEKELLHVFCFFIEFIKFLMFYPFFFSFIFQFLLIFCLYLFVFID